MGRKVGHLVLLKTSMSTKRSIPNISALGLLAQSVNLDIFGADSILQYVNF